MRKQCCLFQKICLGKHCKSERGICRWLGYIITKKLEENVHGKKLQNMQKDYVVVIQ